MDLDGRWVEELKIKRHNRKFINSRICRKK